MLDSTAAFLNREVAQRMDERLELVRIAPQRVLDLGCAGGSDLALLGRRFPQAELLGIDFAIKQLAPLKPRRTLLERLLPGRSRAPLAIAAEFGALPLARASVDLIWSNLSLAALSEPDAALREMHRVLRVGGLLMFSTLGPDTLKELRAVMPAHRGSRVHRFIDMHDLGDALVRAGFADPVMDMEMIQLTYRELDTLFADLAAHGARNAASDRPRGLTGRQGWAAARAAYEALRANGVLPASIELIQGHAWKAAPRTSEDGRAVIQFQPRRAGAR